MLPIRGVHEIVLAAEEKAEAFADSRRRDSAARIMWMQMLTTTNAFTIR